MASGRKFAMFCTPYWLFARRFLLLCSLSLSLGLTTTAVPAATQIVGGTKSAIDEMGNPVAPLITTTVVDGVEINTFSTGSYAAGPFISTLEFQLTLETVDP